MPALESLPGALLTRVFGHRPAHPCCALHRRLCCGLGDGGFGASPAPAPAPAPLSRLGDGGFGDGGFGASPAPAPAPLSGLGDGGFGDGGFAAAPAPAPLPPSGFGDGQITPPHADASASALTSLVTQKDDATLPCVVGLSFLPRVTTAKIDLAIKVSAVASSATLSDESVDDVRRPRPPPTPRPTSRPQTSTPTRSPLWLDSLNS
jgi:hypothetical protein